MQGNLETTNLLLGIMAAVSVLEGLLLIALGVMAYKVYRSSMQMVREVEQRQIAPLVTQVHTLMAKVDGILVDVKGITARVEMQSERVDSAIRTTIDRVDETAGRVRSTLASRVQRVMGIVSGVRDAVDHLFHDGQQQRPPSARAPRAASVEPERTPVM